MKRVDDGAGRNAATKPVAEQPFQPPGQALRRVHERERLSAEVVYGITGWQLREPRECGQR
jgi:hypothetical protein